MITVKLLLFSLLLSVQQKKEMLLNCQETCMIYMPGYLIPNLNATSTTIPFDIEIKVEHFRYAIDHEYINVAQRQTTTPKYRPSI